MLELVGLVGLDRRYPHQLSGGQQQRVALARALAIKPRVVLLDEPFSSLDAELRVGVRRDVARALAETGATTVLVTHDQDEAMALADQIAVLKAGRMVAVAEPHELYRDPLDLVAATSIGEANVLAADIDGNLARCVLGGIPFVARGATPAVGSVRLLLRPEQLVLHVEARANTLRGSVIDAQYHGHDSLVDVVVDGAPAEHFLARAPGNIAFAHGQPVWIEIQGKARVWT
jgi:iron(III) transport system ATP-binding protein